MSDLENRIEKLEYKTGISQTEEQKVVTFFICPVEDKDRLTEEAFEKAKKEVMEKYLDKGLFMLKECGDHYELLFPFQHEN